MHISWLMEVRHLSLTKYACVDHDARTSEYFHPSQKVSSFMLARQAQ